MFRFPTTPRPPATRSAWAAALVLSMFGSPPVRADDEAGPTVLTITPQGEPVPALRYRLLPSSAELNPGNAAPVYMRLYAETLTEAKRQIRDKASAWLDEPFDEFPLQEAQDFVEMWSSRTARMAFAARRIQCDWAYTLPEEREEAYNILLPDLQELRNFARLLALKARVEIAEGTYDEAIRTIETGLAMARHLSEGPFLINNLVGAAVAQSFLDRVEELVGRPGAPNLYWALAALPHPLISFREAFEHEQALGEWVVPEIVGFDELRTEAEWEVRLARLHERLGRLSREFADTGVLPKAEVPDDLPGFRAAFLSRADAFFTESRIEAPAGEAERIVRFVAESYRRARDEAFKATYLPFTQADALYREEAREDNSERLTMPVPVMVPWPLGEIIPAVRTAHLAQARLDRRVAELRVVEAIRLHASANGGSLPESLDAIDEVPVPVDPISGKPFVYRLEGESAILEAPETAMPVASESLPYQITIRE